MANTVANVLEGKPLTTGGILIADTGSTAPTDATTALDGAFVAAGYIGEDGLTETNGRTTNKVKAWGGDIVKVVQTDYSLTYTFTFIESLNTTVLETVYGDDNVTVTAGGPAAGTLREAVLNGDVLPHKAFVFEVRDGLARVRTYVADGQVTEVGAITYNDQGVIAYPATVEAFRDSTIGGNAVKWLDDGVFIP